MFLSATHQLFLCLMKQWDLVICSKTTPLTIIAPPPLSIMVPSTLAPVGDMLSIDPVDMLGGKIFVRTPVKTYATSNINVVLQSQHSCHINCV